MGSEFNKYGGLTFEGEFFHGIKWKGIGKEYYVYGKLKSEIEYLYGKKSGYGKEYNSWGELIYDGKYLDGIRNGYGKEYANYKLIFEGEIKMEKNGREKSKNMIIMLY